MLLKRAQAQGDLLALQAKGRRVVRFHLPEGSVSAGLERVLDAKDSRRPQNAAVRTTGN